MCHFAMVCSLNVLYEFLTDSLHFLFPEQVWTSSSAENVFQVFSNQACLVQNPITVKIFGLSMLFDPISYVAEMVFFKNKPHFRAFQRQPRFGFQGDLLRSITLDDRAVNRWRRDPNDREVWFRNRYPYGAISETGLSLKRSKMRSIFEKYHLSHII